MSRWPQLKPTWRLAAALCLLLVLAAIFGFFYLAWIGEFGLAAGVLIAALAPALLMEAFDGD